MLENLEENLDDIIFDLRCYLDDKLAIPKIKLEDMKKRQKGNIDRSRLGRRLLNYAVGRIFTYREEFMYDFLSKKGNVPWPDYRDFFNPKEEYISDVVMHERYYNYKREIDIPYRIRERYNEERGSLSVIPTFSVGAERSTFVNRYYFDAYVYRLAKITGTYTIFSDGKSSERHYIDIKHWAKAKRRCEKIEGAPVIDNMLRFTIKKRDKPGSEQV